MKKQIQKQNKFVFLYPQKEIFDFMLESAPYLIDKLWWKKRKSYFKPKFDAVKTQQGKEIIQAEAREDRREFFRPIHKEMLNRCITERYRNHGFQIAYALLDNEPLADTIIKYPEDKIIFVGIDAKTHRTERPDGTFTYPNQNYILNQLLPLDRLVIGGFHMWDCVQRLAKTAYERNISVLVDEDLTEFFFSRVGDKHFQTDRYPSYNPRSQEKHVFKMFMNARKGKPWLWQKY